MSPEFLSQLPFKVCYDVKISWIYDCLGFTTTVGPGCHNECLTSEKMNKILSGMNPGFNFLVSIKRVTGWNLIFEVGHTIMAANNMIGFKRYRASWHEIWSGPFWSYCSRSPSYVLRISQKNRCRNWVGAPNCSGKPFGWGSLWWSEELL